MLSRQGAAALAGAALGAFIPCVDADLASSRNASFYVAASVEAIKALNDRWYNAKTGIWDNAWWNSANALTSLADFASLRLNEANDLNLGGYLNNTFIQAQKTNVQTVKSLAKGGMVQSMYCLDSSSGCMAKRAFLHKRGFDDFVNEFYDDEGWWALALIRSHDVSAIKAYLDAAVNIFKDMQTGAGTPCGGGIYWNKERKYVNAIANELYLSVAASLATRIPQNTTYLQMAKAQWQWFQRSGMINATTGLVNDGLDDKCRNNGLQTWSYNQGVILGGLAELTVATNDTQYVMSAVPIAQAAIRALANRDGVLEETDKCELKPGHCGTDGQQFKGIFVRNLRYLNDLAPRPEFRDFIIKNANSIWDKDRDGARLGVAWTGPYIDATGPTQSSALDALVAGIAVA